MTLYRYVGPQGQLREQGEGPRPLNGALWAVMPLGTFLKQRSTTASALARMSVSELCRELGINPVTLYRYVGPQGQLREQGEKDLAP